MRQESTGIENISPWFNDDTGELHIPLGNEDEGLTLPHTDIPAFLAFLRDTCMPLIEQKQQQYDRYAYWSLFMSRESATIAALRGDSIPQ